MTLGESKVASKIIKISLWKMILANVSDWPRLGSQPQRPLEEWAIETKSHFRQRVHHNSFLKHVYNAVSSASRDLFSLLRHVILEARFTHLERAALKAASDQILLFSGASLIFCQVLKYGQTFFT